MGLHVSWFLIFALVTWSLAVAYFPRESSGWLPATSVAIAALASLVYFGSVLLHELGHSWVALRNAIPVRSITLFIFGGVAQIGHVPLSPGVQFRIAIAGPLVSLALAGLFGIVWLVARTFPYLAGPTLWLARTNLLLALFNLIPGLPLDGGRVLQALVWQVSGSYHRATRVALRAGNAMAFGFMALGLFVVTRGGLLNGLWLILIGWFLQKAAAASYTPLTLRGLLRDVTVAQVMSRECLQVADDLPLEQLVSERILPGSRRCLLVAKEGQLLGLVTLHGVLGMPRERWPQVTISQVMVPWERLPTAHPEDEILTVLEQMREADVAQVPVVEGDQLLGIVTRSAILRYVRLRIKSEI